jgi:hypothetical protein
MTSHHVDERCPDRAKLARAVTGAIAEVYKQKGAYDNAKAKKEDRIICGQHFGLRALRN